MNEVFLCLGGNLGNREQNLKTAIQLINDTVGKVLLQSKIYETAAWGITDQPDYLNIVIKMETKLFPENLLNQLLSIEKQLGRERIIKWGSRIIDIDIISYNCEVIEKYNLKIPHPFLHERKFVLIPLSEIAPDWFHPIFKKTSIQLLEDCKDECEVIMHKSTL